MNFVLKTAREFAMRQTIENNNISELEAGVVTCMIFYYSQIMHFIIKIF